MFNLFNKIFDYGGKKVNIIIDNKDNIWFAGREVAEILKYEKTAAKNAIQNNVPDSDKKELGELIQFVDNVPKNTQLNKIYINEAGLYSLIFGSKRKEAIEFKYWVTHTVLPSIRQFGEYKIEERYKQKVFDLNKQLRERDLRIDVLENNQKKQKFPNGGIVYALEPMGITQQKDNLKMLRIGKSEKMQKRWNLYNTSVPENFRLIYYIKTQDPTATELCVRAFLHQYQYRDRKDYYICHEATLKEIFDTCGTSISTRIFPSPCATCQQSMKSSIEYAKHFAKKHKNEMSGGYEIVKLSKRDQKFLDKIEVGLEALIPIQNGGHDIFDAPIETDINSDDIVTPSFTEMAD